MIMYIYIYIYISLRVYVCVNLYYKKYFCKRGFPFSVSWYLSDSKTSEVSRTLLNTLIDLSDAVIWMVSIPPLILNSYSPLFKPMWIVPSELNTTGITVNLIFHNFLNSLASSKYLFIISLSFISTLWSTRMAKSTRG